MHTRRLSCTLLSIMALGVPASSRAEPLTREKAVALAVAQNPQVAAARARRAAAEAQVVQANASRWPEVNVEAGFGPSQAASLVPGSAVASTESRYRWSNLSVVVGGSVNIVQPLYTFGKIDFTRTAADQGVK
ncbi:MAG: TolC family protein, partial [Polyangiaceae bacterium]